MMHAMVRTLRTAKGKATGKAIEFEKDIEEMANSLSKLPTKNKGGRPTWTSTEKQIENGKRIYTTQGVMGCIRCHGGTFQRSKMRTSKKSKFLGPSRLPAYHRPAVSHAMSDH